MSEHLTQPGETGGWPKLKVSYRTDPDKIAALLPPGLDPVSYTHLRAHETSQDLVCRLLLEKKK